MTNAFANEVAAVRPRVTAVVARLVGNDAEDVVQEAVLRAFLSLPQLRDRNSFESWLCGIALNVAKMQLRRAATEARVLAAAGSRVTVDEREPLADVRDAVLLLPSAQRDAVLLHYIEGLSCEEIAAALDTTPGAVKARLHRARVDLRRSLAPHAPAPLKRKEFPMIEMTLEDVIVRVDMEDPTKLVWDQRIVVLREKAGTRRLPIWMGAGEGNALALRLHEATTPRPVTADLMAELVRVLGGAVQQVAVTKLEAKTFYAEVTVDGQTVDARPSDAINLAVRTGAPVLVSATVLDESGIEAITGSDAAEVDVPECVDVPPGEWRSLTKDLLATLYSPPR
jgi:RNA polymerase sigma factor (sigma-70 family)